MKVTFIVDGETLETELDEGATVRDALASVEISPSTVLAVHDGVIIPHDSRLNGDVTMELVVVSSGG